MCGRGDVEAGKRYCKARALCETCFVTKNIFDLSFAVSYFNNHFDFNVQSATDCENKSSTSPNFPWNVPSVPAQLNSLISGSNVASSLAILMRNWFNLRASYRLPFHLDSVVFWTEKKCSIKFYHPKFFSLRWEIFLIRDCVRVSSTVGCHKS